MNPDLAEARAAHLAERPDPDVPDAEEIAWLEEQRDEDFERKYRLENPRDDLWGPLPEPSPPLPTTNTPPF